MIARRVDEHVRTRLLEDRPSQAPCGCPGLRDAPANRRGLADRGVADGRQRGIPERAHDDPVEPATPRDPHGRVPEVRLENGHGVAELLRPFGDAMPEATFGEQQAARAQVRVQIHLGGETRRRPDRGTSGVIGHQHPQEGGTRVGAPGHAHVPDGREGVVGGITHPSPPSLLKRKASRARSTRPLESRPPAAPSNLLHARDRSTDRGSDAWSRTRRTAGSALSPQA